MQLTEASQEYGNDRTLDNRTLKMNFQKPDIKDFRQQSLEKFPINNPLLITLLFLSFHFSFVNAGNALDQREST